MLGTKRYSADIPPTNKVNSRLSSSKCRLPGMALTMPRDTETTYDIKARLPVMMTGPRVIAAQYNRARCASERDLRTRQIDCRLRSMVNISITADATSTRKPTVPSRLALLENCVK
mgnify:CR=1 FL=1